MIAQLFMILVLSRFKLAAGHNVSQEICNSQLHTNLTEHTCCKHILKYVCLENYCNETKSSEHLTRDVKLPTFCSSLEGQQVELIQNYDNCMKSGLSAENCLLRPIGRAKSGVGATTTSKTPNSVNKAGMPLWLIILIVILVIIGIVMIILVIRLFQKDKLKKESKKHHSTKKSTKKHAEPQP